MNLACCQKIGELSKRRSKLKEWKQTKEIPPVSDFAISLCWAFKKWSLHYEFNGGKKRKTPKNHTGTTASSMRDFSPATDKNVCSSASLLSCIALTPQPALALASAVTAAEGTRLSPAQPGPARGPPSPGQGPPIQRVWSTGMRGSAFALRTEMLLRYNYAEELRVFQFRVTGFMQSSWRGE